MDEDDEGVGLAKFWDRHLHLDLTRITSAPLPTLGYPIIPMSERINESLPLPGQTRELLCVFETLLRAYGGQIQIRKSMVSGRKGELISHSRGEYLTVQTKDLYEGNWSPAYAAPIITSPEELKRYAHELAATGIVYTEDLEALRFKAAQNTKTDEWRVIVAEMRHLIDKRKADEETIAQQELERKRQDIRDKKPRRPAPRPRIRGSQIKEESLGEEG